MKNKLTCLLFLLIGLGMFGSMKAQSLYFCEKVDANGNPEGESKTFNISSKGGYFYFLVKLGSPVGCETVKYKIYSVNSYGNENYNATIEQNGLKTNWTYFWKKVTFYEAGNYNVYLYDCNSNIITSASLQIKIK